MISNELNYDNKMYDESTYRCFFFFIPGFIFT